MNKVYLLLHGRGNQPDGDKSAFFPDMQAYLEGQGYKVLAPHLPYADGWTFEQTIESLNKLILEEGNGELSIVGHSSGGYLACHLATQYKVNKIVLIAPTCPLPHFSNRLHELIRTWFDNSGVEHYENFHKHEINIDKIIERSNDINIWFGAQDPYIDTGIRQRYAKEFAYARSFSFNVLPNRGHMGADEGVTSLPEIYPHL